MTEELQIKKIIKNALLEDIGTGDITTNTIINKEATISGKILAKEEGIICGTQIFKWVFETIDPTVEIAFNFSDGDSIKKNDLIGKVKGNTRSILTAERVALNFLQRLSGISTKTAFLVTQINNTHTKITDTRKTTPGLRILEKYAVKIGGGVNHRFNLSDGILIKDNHIKGAMGIRNAVKKAKENAPHTLKIEVEVETIEQVKEALEAKADGIMLDNMSLETMKKAVEIIDKKALTEASGNMDGKDIQQIANMGINYISIGGLTHTIKALDISLKF
ncbi:nicotinate-nucleotide pyrophosphorylase [carboxylating] [Natranaerovirga hydrolytica]|uniref:Probable nicotinate-nucleotide pyrophosphorylase [carboxylating] n=1 Tax=Natranaerovirga hydrolytica TaxID=680378 RepID=A0A4R1MAL2_9FIRM|nr:carboxylating nicotinate-nucleotide diphosphorylase [Natranaerovirga hydrolytica]TCK87994.1 nicotinate-nucleotide pyrophosphorylase [carboxylating] [Natranaerovirga hydrolytica]